MLLQRLISLVVSFTLGALCLHLLLPLTAKSPSGFLQRIAELKQGRLPSIAFVQALERYDQAEFAQAVCRHSLGATALVCQEQKAMTIGWAVCLAGGRSAQECGTPKRASLGFGLCMAGGRDLGECHYVEDSSTGFGLCMAAQRTFNECTPVTNPSLAFAYCMERGEDLSSCLSQHVQRRILKL